MKWTRTPPKKAGYYWHRCKDPKAKVGVRKLSIMVWTSWQKFCPKCEFAGPIKPPKEK